MYVYSFVLNISEHFFIKSTGAGQLFSLNPISHTSNNMPREIYILHTCLHDYHFNKELKVLLCLLNKTD